VAALTSACTTGANYNPADNYYNPRTSVNPACNDGFRPTNNWTCSYWPSGQAVRSASTG